MHRQLILGLLSFGLLYPGNLRRNSFPGIPSEKLLSYRQGMAKGILRSLLACLKQTQSDVMQSLFNSNNFCSITMTDDLKNVLRKVSSSDCVPGTLYSCAVLKPVFDSLYSFEVGWCLNRDNVKNLVVLALLLELVASGFVVDDNKLGELKEFYLKSFEISSKLTPFTDKLEGADYCKKLLAEFMQKDVDISLLELHKCFFRVLLEKIKQFGYIVTVSQLELILSKRCFAAPVA